MAKTVKRTGAKWRITGDFFFFFDGTLDDNISCVARDQRETSGVVEGNRCTPPLHRRQHDEGPNFTATCNLNEWAADASGVITTLWCKRQQHFLHVFTNPRVVLVRFDCYLAVPHLHD